MYSPLPSQERFHRSTARFKGYSGPVGSGKSAALCQEALRLAHVNAGRTGLIGAPTYPMLRDATLGAFLAVLHDNGVPYEHNKSENTVVLKDSGSTILFRAVEEYERLRGPNLSWFGVDELTYAPEESWLRLEARLRDPRARRLTGFGVWTPRGFDWVYKRFVSGERTGYEVIFAKANENRHLLHKVPDYYERLKSSYDELFYRQEVLGEYLNVQQSRVYHCFDRRLHVAEVTDDGRSPVLWSLDFNVEPHCSVIAQMEGTTVRVVDEVVLKRGSTLQACQEFDRRVLGAAFRTVRIYGDASGARMQTTGHSDYEVIREFFRSAGYRDVQYRVPASNPPVVERIALVNAKLRSANGVIDVRISPRCRETIADLEQVTYLPGTAVIDKQGDPQRTHSSDALGYLIWEECRRRSPAGEQGRRLI